MFGFESKRDIRDHRDVLLATRKGWEATIDLVTKQRDDQRAKNGKLRAEVADLKRKLHDAERRAALVPDGSGRPPTIEVLRFGQGPAAKVLIDGHVVSHVASVEQKNLPGEASSVIVTFLGASYVSRDVTGPALAWDERIATPKNDVKCPADFSKPRPECALAYQLTDKYRKDWPKASQHIGELLEGGWTLDMLKREGYVEPKTGEWTEWNGGECPVPNLTVKIDVRFRDGKEYRKMHAGGWRWSHRNVDSDIVAYRVVSTEPKEPHVPQPLPTWIEWEGGDRPVSRETKVDVRFRNGEERKGIRASTWNWGYTCRGEYDIVAYRVAQ